MVEATVVCMDLSILSSITITMIGKPCLVKALKESLEPAREAI